MFRKIFFMRYLLCGVSIRIEINNDPAVGSVDGHGFGIDHGNFNRIFFLYLFTHHMGQSLVNSHQ